MQYLSGVYHPVQKLYSIYVETIGISKRNAFKVELSLNKVNATYVCKICSKFWNFTQNAIGKNVWEIEICVQFEPYGYSDFYRFITTYYWMSFYCHFIIHNDVVVYTLRFLASKINIRYYCMFHSANNLLYKMFFAPCQEQYHHLHRQTFGSIINKKKACGCERYVYVE